ncbi:hypothetical protein EV181_001331 [Coemansia sp. RSA 532]|nr:hypothetical protein EV181_001331 [Coemansia sp. RSA 532]KAJ2290241.1 hypothetical protein IW141_003391 [Coemansia sp. RSA 355]
METDAGRATRHKQPFAPIELAVEPTKETVFRRAFDAHVVRAFIGPTTTDWMQQHKRWWTRTAEKMENRGATRTIRRRLSKPEAQDSLNELFVRSHDSDVSDAVASDWSMDSSDSESACSEMEGSEVHSVHVTVASPEIEQSVTSPEIEQSVMSPEIEQSVMNEPTTIPMPELPSSPRDQPLKTAPTSTHERPHTARRRSSLQTLKGLFRRHSTSSKLRRSSDAAVEGRRSLDTVPSVSSTDEQSDRGRALSLSHGNNGSVRSPSQLAPRSSLDAGATSPKLSSLRRIAVTRNSLSASWQSQAEPAKPEPAKPEPAKPEPDKQDTVLPPALNPADMHVQLASLSTSDTTQSRINKSRRAMVAKVRAYYSRHAHISETTVLLSTRAVVRRETAAAEAFTDKYNEVTCMQYRQSSQEWAEMWLALTKRGIMFYLASKKRPAVAVQFPPYASVAPRVSLFSTLDLSLAIMYPRHAASTDIRTEDPDAKSSLRVVVIKFPSAQVARTWYREIGQALLLGRVAYPGAFLNETQPAALPAPSSVAVHVPELGIKVQVQLGRHSLEVPPSVLLGGSDDAVLERQWRREATTVWHVRRDAVNALLRDPVASAQTQEWIDREQRGELTLGMAWRRHDRLDWIIPCGALDAHGCFRVATVSDSVVGPQLLERTHALELRVLEHYPDSVAVDNTQMAEPVGMEGFVMLKHEKRIVSYRPALLTTHNGLVFVVSAPRAARHMEAHTQQCTLSHAESSALDAPAVRYYHPDAQNCSKQMSLARYMLNITDVEQIEPIQPDDTHKHAGLRSKRARQALCKFRMVTRTGASVVVWTSSTLCMREWVDRLTNLRLYWTHRLMADHALHSQTCMLNYPGQGRSSRVRDDADWFDEGMWAERQIWHACLILGCRTIIKSGILYRKRRHHQGMRKVFCILTHSRLIEFSYPVAPLAPGQSMLAEHMLRNEPTMAHVFRNILSEPVSQTSASILFSKSRSLSLHRCYVVSRFTDDLSERDIMCEPWVMTDIGNYTGLRLADRVYADGVVSHELITDCIFTVWRPTFVPMILRSSAAEINPASDDCVSAEPPRMPASPRMPSVPDCPSISPHRGSLDYRSSADGYNSSISTSSVSSSPAHDTKPGAHRVGDEVRLSIDKKDGSKHNAMRSSMRHRVGVYKARTNSEMAQWVTAINQEIRRMSLHGEW